MIFLLKEVDKLYSIKEKIFLNFEIIEEIVLNLLYKLFFIKFLVDDYDIKELELFKEVVVI